MSIFYVNEAHIVGNLAKDPELRYTSSGTAVMTCSVATNHSYKNGENWEEKTTYHNIVSYGKAAERAAQFAHKGDQVVVVGRIDNRSWEHEGKKYYKTEIVADKFILGKPKNQNSQPAQATPAPQSSEPDTSKHGQESVDPSDIPF